MLPITHLPAWSSGESKSHLIGVESQLLCFLLVVPAKAGRSAKRGEHPKDGPEGVSEANHPATLRRPKGAEPGLRRGG